MTTSIHRCVKVGDAAVKCTPANARGVGGQLYVLDDGRRVCHAHMPKPRWNRETCTHTPRGGTTCPFCGATGLDGPSVLEEGSR